LREIFSFLEDVETTNRATLKGMADFSIDQGRVQKYSMKNVSSMTPDELCDEVLALQVRPLAFIFLFIPLKRLKFIYVYYLDHFGFAFQYNYFIFL